MSTIKSIIQGIISLFLPSFLTIRLLNLMGQQISKDAYIGFTWLQCTHLRMEAGSRIGHFNLIRIQNLELGKSASVRNFNRFKGPLSIIMAQEAAIGNSNSIYRGPFPITEGKATLRLGRLAIVTSKHQLDCTKSISIGAYSTISGFDTQFWTHGFYHANTGAERIRIDGPIHIGHNVSIGSRCLLNPGIKIADCINVGGNACISKSLKEPGMYVSQPLRYLVNDIRTIRQKLVRNPKNTHVEVYEK